MHSLEFRGKLRYVKAGSHNGAKIGVRESTSKCFENYLFKHLISTSQNIFLLSPVNFFRRSFSFGEGNVSRHGRADEEIKKSFVNPLISWQPFVQYICSPMKKYKHIFFDLDETLWDFKSNSLESLHDIFDQHELVKHGIEKEKFIRRYNHHNDFYWDKFRKGEIAHEQLRIIRFEKTLNEFEVSDGALVENSF